MIYDLKNDFARSLEVDDLETPRNPQRGRCLL